MRRLGFAIGTVLLGTGVMLLAFGGGTTSFGMPDVLDLTPYHVTFADEFDQLDVSPWGPHTRWTAHTPWNGDFGDAAFSNPAPEFPFTIQNGVLRIEARKMPDGKWRSGLLSSTDPKGNGFTQQFGYFEMRAKLPPGPGLWPAFWLIANRDPDTSAEIDIMEHYGVAPDKYKVSHACLAEGRPRSPISGAPCAFGPSRQSVQRLSYLRRHGRTGHHNLLSRPGGNCAHANASRAPASHVHPG